MADNSTGFIQSIGSSQNYILYIIIGSILLLAIVVWILIRAIKKRKANKPQVPIELLEIFNEAEKQMKGGIENGTNPNPYKILWNITRRKAKDSKFYSSTFPADTIDTGANQQPINQQQSIERQGGIAERSDIQAETSSNDGAEQRNTKRRFQPIKPANI